MLALERFKTAQGSPDSGFESALAEMQAGSKQGHWIWYVFPQLSGLGVSRFSKTYGIRDVAEAMEYLRDPLLCSRLVTITTAVADRLGQGVSPIRLMSSRVDVMKLVSSLTLFEHVARKLYKADGDETHRALAHIAAEVLAVAESGDYPRCPYTVGCLGR